MTDVKIADDFSKTPGGRYRTDGPFSGEEFREEFLKPALNDSQKVTVYLDGTRGYPSSFLDEAFAGLEPFPLKLNRNGVCKSVDL